MSSTLDDIRIRDPFILETRDGSSVLHGTTDANVRGGPATGFDCCVSDDLERWSGPIAAFRPPADFWSDSQFWAPELHEHAGRYFVFATFLPSRAGARGVAVLVGDAATGPFEPWSRGPVTPAGVPGLDGTFFVDDQQRPWLIYSRGAEGTPGGAPAIADGEMYALELTADLSRAAGEPHLLFRASDAAWSRPLRLPDGAEPPAALRLARDPLLTDGPFVLRSGGGALLMLWSSFGEEGYAMGLATSASGDVSGPWAQQPDLVWERDGGHGMILRTTSGADYLVLHPPNESPRERARLVPVDITGSTVRRADSGGATAGAGGGAGGSTGS
ncbi:glycoside hydrolase family 43 protein [Kineococcus glutinatus]|uniref:Glycoside hydrolase family 43 protein n=1 Tax=Kineococcus glutinatus TaxID=1070872 RepID=A0ABP9HT17_9ACTN